MDIIKIQAVIKSRNTINKIHRYSLTRLIKQYAFLVNNQMVLNKIRKAEPNEKFMVTITTHRKRPIRDWDNLVGGVKQMLDSLTHRYSGFIWDDSIKLIGEPKISQTKAKGEEYTEITREPTSSPQSSN